MSCELREPYGNVWLQACCSQASRTARRVMLAIACLLSAGVSDASAQQSVTEVLSFLMTNRAIPTDDFERDAAAAAQARDTIANFLVLELASLPVTSSSGGFTYRLDPALGLSVRSSDSFGPFFTERTLTSGRDRASFGLSYRSARYDAIDGNNLRDGTLVSTASILTGDTQPFDIETVSLEMRTDTVTLTGNYGVTDRLDIGAAIPFAHISLSGQRVDTYRGTPFTQAIASAQASGLGDIVLRAKYNVLRTGASGVSVGAETRLATGNEENLLGAGEASFAPRGMASYEGDYVGVHGEVAYSFGGVADTLSYGAAMTWAASPRFTVIGELIGRRIDGVGRLVSTTQPHSRLIGVQTIRLSAIEEITNSVVAVGGFKWNIGGSWLLTANVLQPLTDVGLKANWVPTITFDYAFGG
jgi:hypothetical protein